MWPPSLQTTQLIICIQWVDQVFHCLEDFIGLHLLGKVDKNAFVETIKIVLIRMRSWQGQNHDEGSSMKGSKNGVASRLGHANTF